MTTTIYINFKMTPHQSVGILICL